MHVYLYSLSHNSFEEQAYLRPDATITSLGVTIPAPSSVEKKEKTYTVVWPPFGNFFIQLIALQSFGSAFSNPSHLLRKHNAQLLITLVIQDWLFYVSRTQLSIKLEFSMLEKNQV